MRGGARITDTQAQLDTGVRVPQSIVREPSESDSVPKSISRKSHLGTDTFIFTIVITIQNTKVLVRRVPEQYTGKMTGDDESDGSVVGSRASPYSAVLKHIISKLRIREQE